MDTTIQAACVFPGAYLVTPLVTSLDPNPDLEFQPEPAIHPPL